jgi:flavin reductase (DIM6/NTAB) family NADH-FMN oxidoreductase RutF
VGRLISKFHVQILNVRDTGEFIINIAIEELASTHNLTATELPTDIDEFENAGLSKLPGRAVRPLG